MPDGSRFTPEAGPSFYLRQESLPGLCRAALRPPADSGAGEPPTSPVFSHSRSICGKRAWISRARSGQARLAQQHPADPHAAAQPEPPGKKFEIESRRTDYEPHALGVVEMILAARTGIVRLLHNTMGFKRPARKHERGLLLLTRTVVLVNL